jgi:hypothetical protein
MLEGDESTFQQ